MITFRCPACQMALGVQPHLAGTASACPGCRQRFIIPTRAARTLPPPPHEPRRHAPPRSGALVPVFAVTGLLLALVGLGAGVFIATAPSTKPPPKVAEDKDGPPLGGKKDDPAEKEKPLPGGEEPPEKGKPREKEKPPEKEDVPAGAVGEALALLNAERKKAGVPALALDVGLSGRCAEHAGRLAASPYDTHTGLPGSSHARKGPAEAMKGWLAAPLHRELLLARGRDGVGLASAGGVTVIAGVFAAAGDGSGAVVYPGAGQANVPLLFPGNEVPDPLPDLENKVTGYPVTATFPRRARVTDTEMTMEDEAGGAVPVHDSGPGRPANKAHASHQGNTLCAFPKKVLEPSRRYLVRARAKVDGKAWSRTWSFTTAAREPFPGKRVEAALVRFNSLRKAAGLAPVALDGPLTKGCQKHAEYLGRHFVRGKDIPINREDPALEGYTKEGHEAAERAAIRLNAPDGPGDGVDWIYTSVMNRNLALSPSMRSVGIGVAPQGRGHVWVINMPSLRRRGDGPPVAYPGDGQKGIPIYFGRDLSEIEPGAAKGAKAGFPVTLSFFPLTKLSDIAATLKDGDGNEVVCLISTPDKRLPGTGNYAQVVLVPKRPLAHGAAYTAEVALKADGKPFTKKWTFTAEADPYDEAKVAAKLVEELNAVRKAAGLGEVVLDAAMSKACRLHALYLEKNLEHPKVQGLGIHEEDETLPGYTKEGQKAGKVSVIAVLPGPAEAMEMWVATLYHRIPLLNPALKKVGYGQGRHAVRGYIPVMDTSGGR